MATRFFTSSSCGMDQFCRFGIFGLDQTGELAHRLSMKLFA
jgi:hypothetical protein